MIFGRFRRYVKWLDDIDRERRRFSALFIGTTGKVGGLEIERGKIYTLTYDGRAKNGLLWYSIEDETQHGAAYRLFGIPKRARVPYSSTPAFLANWEPVRDVYGDLVRW